MQVDYPEIGICGLSCRLCPSYHIEGKSRCAGCKSANRMAVGCPFITCAVKKKGIEFCSRPKLVHSILDEMAHENGCCLKLRK